MATRTGKTNLMLALPINEHRQLKIAAAERGTTMTWLILAALRNAGITKPAKSVKA